MRYGVEHVCVHHVSSLEHAYVFGGVEGKCSMEGVQCWRLPTSTPPAQAPLCHPPPTNGCRLILIL